MEPTLDHCIHSLEHFNQIMLSSPLARETDTVILIRKPWICFLIKKAVGRQKYIEQIKTEISLLHLTGKKFQLRLADNNLYV